MSDEPITTAAQMREAAALCLVIQWPHMATPEMVQQIRAIPIAPPDDAMVEQVALAIQEAHRLYGRCWREMARAAIAAMGGGDE